MHAMLESNPFQCKCAVRHVFVYANTPKDILFLHLWTKRRQRCLLGPCTVLMHHCCAVKQQQIRHRDDRVVSASLQRRHPALKSRSNLEICTILITMNLLEYTGLECVTFLSCSEFAFYLFKIKNLKVTN